MLRVAYVFERFPSFGQTFCYREVAELMRQGAEVTVFSIRKPAGEPPQDWNEELVRKVHYLPGESELVAEVGQAIRRGKIPAEAARSIGNWGRQNDFLRLYQAVHIGLRMRDAGIDRIHAHFAGMAARTAYWIKQFFGIDYSVTAHANDIFAPRDFVVSLAKIFNQAVAIVTVSDFSAEQLRERFPADSAKVRRVYNGVDLAAFRPAEIRLSATPLIVSVGRLIEKKGFAELIAACALLKQRGVSFRCEIIGEGPLEADLTAQIDQTQLRDCVLLVGPRSQREIAERFRAASLFVLACTIDRDGGMDNLPTVIMEAMAAGLPVISTPIAGVPEMVQAGKTGEFVPCGDPAALSGAMERLLTNPSATAEFGRRGRELAAEKFSIEANVSELARILAPR